MAKIITMNTPFNQIFFLRKSKGQPKSEATIYLRITVNGVRTEISMQRNSDPQKWVAGVGRLSGKSEDVKSANKYLDAVEHRIYEIYRNLIADGKIVIPELIKAHYFGVSEMPRLLIDIYSHHNEQVAALVGKDYAIGTLKKFKTALASLKAFLRWKFNVSDVSLKEVNYQFITEYEFYLKSIQGVQHNSAMGIIKKLKKIIRQCVANDWIAKDPFVGYKIRTQETSRDYLIESELEELSNKILPVNRLSQVRDIFVFSCFTGLSFSDVANLTASNITKGIDGEKWIEINRTKTDEYSPIPLLPVPLAILAKYANHPKTNDRLLPILSNQRMNSYLKELADICGIKKNLSFHCARHTFATTVTLTNGVPIESVSKMLGHKTLRTTQIYAKVLNVKLSRDMQVLKERLSKK